MKAEHRKELQTNTLADNLGRMIQGGRQMNRRTVLIVVALVVLVGGYYVWRMIQNNVISSQAVAMFVIDQGNWQELESEVIKGNPDSKASKLAQFQIAWLLLWKEGIEPLASKPFQAKRGLDMAQKMYQDLAELSEGDPVLSAEARYSLALIEESLAATELTPATRNDRVGNATKLYGQLATDDNLKDTAHGKQAKARAEYLEKNRAQVVAFYDQMANRTPLDIGEFLRQMNQKKDLEQKEQKDQPDQKK